MRIRTFIILFLIVLVVLPAEVMGGPRKKRKKHRRRAVRTEIVDKHQSGYDDGAEPDTDADKVIHEARKYLGTPYRYGGRTTKGFDCSGFTKYVYAKFGFNLSPSAPGQYRHGTGVDRYSLKKGDLVFFGGRRNSRSIGHVGIVTDADNPTGKFYFIHSSRSGVRVSSSDEQYYINRYVGARRILGIMKTGENAATQVAENKSTEKTAANSAYENYQLSLKIHRPGKEYLSDDEFYGNDTIDIYVNDIVSAIDTADFEENYDDDDDMFDTPDAVMPLEPAEPLRHHQTDDSNYDRPNAVDEYVPEEILDETPDPNSSDTEERDYSSPESEREKDAGIRNQQTNATGNN